MIAAIEEKADWLTLPEVAKVYRHTYDGVARWCSIGVSTNWGPLRLKRRRAGGKWLIRSDWLRQFMRACNGNKDAFRECQRLLEEDNDWSDEPPVAETPAAARARGKREQEQAARELRRGRK